jgi:hypothetical protein
MAAHICLQSLWRYLAWWWSAVVATRREAPGRTLRRLLVLLVGFPCFLLLQLVHWICWMLDAVLFPSARGVPVRRPIFITGIPRSGTTYVHRSLAGGPGLVTFTTWEAILAPSLLQKRIVRGLASLDRRVGRPLRTLLDWLLAKLSGDFDAIHGIGLAEPEEDYLALLPFGGCFLLALAFPSVPELRDLARFDRLPKARRDALLGLYHQCLQKKLYGCPEGTRLISKNAAFASWLPPLAENYPDAVFIICVRAPLEALSSQLSSLSPARSAFGTDPCGSATAELMRQVFQHNYAQLAALAGNAALRKRCRILEQGDLGADPANFLTRAAEFADLPRDAAFFERLSRVRPAGKSRHQHDAASIPGDNDAFLEATTAAYAAILDLDCRIQSS